MANANLATLDGAAKRDDGEARAENERLAQEKAEADRRTRDAEERARRAETAAVEEQATAARPAAATISYFKDPTTGMEFVPVKGGCFQMGETVSTPVHEVCIGDFAIGKFETTQSQWKQIMGSNPSNFSSCGDTCPVENVSWNEVQEFIKKLNGLSAKQYRLPTEAEWEYAARSGGKKEKYAGTSVAKKAG